MRHKLANGSGRRTALAAVIAAALFVAPLQASASGEPESGLDTAPAFVHDAPAQFRDLSLRPDGLGFSLGSAPNPDSCRHLQGVARYQAANGANYLFVTRSGNFPLPCTGNDGVGSLWVIRMGSREHTGERMRSNRLGPDWPKPPDRRDRVVQTIFFDGSATADGSNPRSLRYAHPGGMQLIGDVLVVALEAPLSPDPDNLIAFIDVSVPEEPKLLSTFANFRPGSEFSAGLVGITPIATPAGRRYVMVVAGAANRDVRFYRSLSSDLAARDLKWEEIGSFTNHEIDACSGATWPEGAGAAHQTLNFVRQGDLSGPVYMVGIRNTFVTSGGDDMFDLYEVELAAEGFMVPCPIKHRRTLHVDSAPYIFGDDSTNGQAAAAAYVSPSGELIVYVTELENDGPEVDGVQTIRFGEYRNRGVVDGNNSPTLLPGISSQGPFVVDEGSSVALSATGTPPATKAYIQLYEDDDAGTSFPGNVGHDAWVNVDYPDRLVDRFGDLVDLLDTDETTGSWRWFAPAGCTIFANDYPVHSDEFPGPATVALRGRGLYEVANDLDALRVYHPADSPYPVSPVPAGATSSVVNYDDDVGGITFGADCDSYYSAAIGVSWDLDGDGAFETVQPASFDAAQLDGPATRSVAARAQHPTDPTPLGTSAPITVPVEVRNVAPRISSAVVADSLGNDVGSGSALAVAGLPLTLDVTFRDPGLADTQTAVVDWGDGSSDTAFDTYSDARSGALGVLRDAHAFATPGTYDIRATITDDDGAATPVTISVEVVSLEDVVQAVADDLTDLIAAATDAEVAAALRNAREELLGNHDGKPPTNGALDKLEADDAVGAITKLRAAISYLMLAESSGAGDLSAMEDLLGLVAEAIAGGAYQEAQLAVAPPSPGEARALSTIAALIAQGHLQLGDGQYLDACDRFRQATAKALQLVR
jgi:PKD domain